MPAHFHVALHRRRLLQVAIAAPLLAHRQLPRDHALAQATPAPEASPGPTVLVDMLRLIPASVLVEKSGSWFWDYMDLAQQLASLEVQESTIENPWPPGHFSAVYPLWTSAAAYKTAALISDEQSLHKEFVATIGFAPLAIGQCLTVGTAPDSVSIYRGGIDPGRIEDAWAAHGYAPLTSAGGLPYWSLGDLDHDDPIQRYSFGQLNNLAVVDDMVIAARSPDLVERVLDSRGSGEPLILDIQEFHDAIAGMPAQTVSAIGAGPSFAPVSPHEDVMATQAAIAEESGPMPPYLMIVAGVTAGLAGHTMVDGTPTPFEPAPGAGLAVVRLATVSESDAIRAARVAEHRWQAGTSIIMNRPFTDWMEVRSAQADGTVAEIVFDHVRNPRAWFRIFITRDNFPFAVG